jgi:choline-sulfatase
VMRPNILWIQTDEQRPDSLGCYGSPWARTPHVDALASSGTLFHTAVCQSPVCVPSRASQLTARYPQEVNTLLNGVAESELLGTSNEGQSRTYPEGTVTFPEVLAASGYQTVSIGKIHTPTHPTWQRVSPMVNDTRYAGYFGLAPGYDEDAYRVVKRPGSTPVIVAGTYPSATETPSSQITDEAIQWLHDGRDPGRPFLLRISHNWPHTPVLPPAPYDTLYDPADLPVRYFDRRAYEGRSSWDREIADMHRMRECSKGQIDQMWADYMGLCAYVDHEVGRALAALEALGLRETTIVVFSADHGKALGEWGATEKGFFDQQVWRVPFVWSWPGTIPAGVVRSDLCELVDTGRTLLALTGVTAPKEWRGRALFDDDATTPAAVFGQIGWPDGDVAAREVEGAEGVGHSQNVPPQEVLFDSDPKAMDRRGGPASRTHWDGMRVAVRTADYRMDEHWMRSGKRVDPEAADGNLFDLVDDPDERENLWTRPEHRGVVREMRGHLEGWFASLSQPAPTFSDSGDARDGRPGA